jgi:hypothetical protein
MVHTNRFKAPVNDNIHDVTSSYSTSTSAQCASLHQHHTAIRKPIAFMDSLMVAHIYGFIPADPLADPLLEP